MTSSSSSSRRSKSTKGSKNTDASKQIVDVVADSNASQKVASSRSNVKSPSEIGGGPTQKTSMSKPTSFSNEISGVALGMIETRGLVPAIEAADAMTKAAEVRLIAREFVGGGYVSVLVRGETGAVNASVRAGADACERVGDGLVAAHIIARPDPEVEPVLQQNTAKRRL